MSDDAGTYRTARIYTYDRHDRLIACKTATSEEIREIEARWPVSRDVPLSEVSPLIRDPGACEDSVTYVEGRLAPLPPPVAFEHDRAAGVFRLTAAEGPVEVFRDRPVRYLCVEPDPGGGEMRPVLQLGQPVYLYLCREEREAR